jgi:hypothetical protein
VNNVMVLAEAGSAIHVSLIPKTLYPRRGCLHQARVRITNNSS